MASDVQNIISITKDVIMSVAAVVTTAVAVIGVNKWWQELRGKTEYEVARRIIRALYKVRDGFMTARSPFIWAVEYPEGYAGTGTGGQIIDDKKANISVYQNRWTGLVEVFRELESEVLEAEVIWGQDIQTCMGDLRSCRNEFQLALHQYFTNIDDIWAHPDREHYQKLVGKISNFNNDEDEFSKRIILAINLLEQKVLPHLKR